MKNIVLFGSGKSSTVLIKYLVKEVQQRSWHLIVADHDEKLVREKLQEASCTTAMGLDVSDEPARSSLVRSADVVISLLPPSLHILVAKDCLVYGKNLLTASYLDAAISAMKEEVAKKGLLFLCEMGLDPGIDHMSAMAMLNRIREAGGEIYSFRSHCGGLVAPESDNNPWRYKISWNPRNVVNAGKAGADYLEHGKKVHKTYPQVFESIQYLEVNELPSFAWYANRDSLAYIPVYGLEQVNTFIRTTLRYPEFIFGWNNIIHLGLTRDDLYYDTDGMSLKQFFHEHFRNNGFSEWLETQLTQRIEQTKSLLDKLNELLEIEESAGDSLKEGDDEMMLVTATGEIKNYNLEKVKMEAAATVAGSMQEAGLTMKQLFYLGMDDDQTIINKGHCSAADILQFILEHKLKLEDHDKDMIVMVHEIEYILGDKKFNTTSSMKVIGEDSLYTAMAKTVGMPLGIAAILILEGKLTEKGVQIPTLPSIYEPVLEELEKQGLFFTEQNQEIN